MKAIFLDIDGVLQPGSYQDRFKHMNEVSDLAIKLNKELHNGFDYYKFAGGDKEKDNPQYDDKYDIAAVYWDWHPEAVANLQRILDETGAKIVLSTDWRGRGMEVMKGLLDIKGFGNYVYGATFFPASYGAPAKLYSVEEKDQMYRDTYKLLNNLRSQLSELYPPHKDVGIFISGSFETRSAEIWEYLDRHPEITSYVALDDLYLGCGLEKHFVWSRRGWLRKEATDEAIAALSIEDGPYHLPASVVTDELKQFREKWIKHSKHYY